LTGLVYLVVNFPVHLSVLTEKHRPDSANSK
jgi:hypothetical protein